MAEDSQYDVGVRLKGEASSLAGAGKTGVESLKAVEEQAKRTGTALEQQAQAQRNATTEATRARQQLDAQAAAQALLTRETDAYGRTVRGATAEVLAKTAAMSALQSMLRGVIRLFTGPAGIASLIAGAALSWVSFGTAAEQGASAAEDAARRTKQAAQELSTVTTVTNLATLIGQRGTQIANLEGKRDAVGAGEEYKARLQADIDALRLEQQLLANAAALYVQPGGAAQDGITIAEATRGIRTASSLLDDLQRRLEAIDKAFGGEMARVAGNQVLSEAERMARVAELETQRREFAAALNRDYVNSVSALEQRGIKPPAETSDFERLQRQASGLLAVTNARAEGTEKLTRAEVLLAQTEEAYAQGLLKNVTPAQMAQLKVIYDQAAANEKEAAAREVAKRATEAHVKAYERDMDAGARVLWQREQELKRMELHNEEIGLSTEQLGRLRIARAEETLAAEQQAYAYAGLYAASERELELAKERLRQAEEFVRLTRQGVARDISAEQAKRTREEWQKTSDYVQRTLTDALMRGFERGSLDGMALIKNMFATLVLEPILRPIFTPIASTMAGASQSLFAGAGNWFNRSPSTPSYNSSMDWGSAAGWGTAAAGSGAAATGAASWIPYVGWAMAAAMVASDMQDKQRRAQYDFLGPTGESLFGKSYNQSLNPFGSFLRGQISRGDMMTGMLAPGLVHVKGDTRRSGMFAAGLGESHTGMYPWLENRWFSDSEMGDSLRAYQEQIFKREQNLIRNLNLSPGQRASVNAALAGPNAAVYDFGPEHTDWQNSQAFGRIAADRLQAISQALGRSIEELTSIMEMSAEQWQAMIGDLREQLRQGELELARAARALPGQLGIPGLQGWMNTLAVSDYNLPEDRVANALALFRSTRDRALGGDLGAVFELPNLATSALGIGREAYASGQIFQDLRTEIEAGMTAAMAHQQELQLEILRDVPAAIMESSNNQIEELQRGFKAMVDKVEELRLELVSLQAT